MQILRSSPQQHSTKLMRLSSTALLPTPLLPDTLTAKCGEGGNFSPHRSNESNADDRAEKSTDGDKQQHGCSANATRFVRYKTEMCRNFKERGMCIYGEQCQFAHGHCEMRQVTRNTKYKTKRCIKFWTEGYCVYGPRCNFLHADSLSVTSGDSGEGSSSAGGGCEMRTMRKSDDSTALPSDWSQGRQRRVSREKQPLCSFAPHLSAISECDMGGGGGKVSQLVRLTSPTGGKGAAHSLPPHLKDSAVRSAWIEDASNVSNDSLESTLWNRASTKLLANACPQ